MSDPAEADEPGPRHGIGLALSGGGYRAMLFHMGALWRLNEVGLLGRLDRVSSVSGGSITAAVLALEWGKLGFQDGVAAGLELVLERVRRLADTTIDVGAILGGLLLPGTINERVVRAYDRILFDGATLQDLPERPEFVINATNMATGALFRFSRRYMADYRVGMAVSPKVPLARAVAASSAFPPFLSPALVDLAQMHAVKGADLHVPPYTQRAVLSDGGVYDNLGLEQLKHSATVLVSDGGAKIAPEPRPRRDWARHLLRVVNTTDNQVRSLRKRHLIEAYGRQEVDGTYWGIRTHWQDYGLDCDPLGAAARDPSALAEIPTRLAAMRCEVQNRLMNWGYAVCDAAVRRHLDPAKFGITIPPPRFPFAGEY